LLSVAALLVLRSTRWGIVLGRRSSIGSTGGRLGVSTVPGVSTVGISLHVASTTTTSVATSSAAWVTTATTGLVSGLSGGSVSRPGHIARRPLLLLIVELLVEGDGLAFVQGLETILVDVGIMDKDIVGSIGGFDEPKALVAKEFYGALE